MILKIFIISSIIPFAFGDEGIAFNLFTRKNPDKPQIIATNDLPALKQSNFDFGKRTWFFIHGWKGAAEYGERKKNAILDGWDENVISVDWSGVAELGYPEARALMEPVAAEFGDFINFLKAQSYDDAKINLVGFSLGAHMAGMAAENVEGGFQGRIVGIDPPQILFNMFSPEGRLSGDDAPYVEVLHSSGMYAGVPFPIGDVDMYLNGGLTQPAPCPAPLRGGDPLASAFCSHVIADRVFERSLEQSRPMVATRCDGGLAELAFSTCSAGPTMHLGGYMPKDWKRGIYYVKS